MYVIQRFWWYFAQKLSWGWCVFGGLRVPFGHFLRGRSLKGRWNIRLYVPVCVPVCVPPPSPWSHPYCGTEQQNPPPPRSPTRPFPLFPHPYLQAIAWPTPGKNYPLKSARTAESTAEQKNTTAQTVSCSSAVAYDRLRESAENCDPQTVETWKVAAKKNQQRSAKAAGNLLCAEAVLRVMCFLGLREPWLLARKVVHLPRGFAWRFCSEKWLGLCWVECQGTLFPKKRSSESVKCRFSKCRFSAELEKLEKIFEMGGGVEKQIQKTLGQHFHSVAVQE